MSNDYLREKIEFEDRIRKDERDKERENVLRELSILIHEWEVVAEGTAHWSSFNRVYRKIESMRQEGKEEQG